MYKRQAEDEGQVLPKQQLDHMARRFDKLSTRLSKLHGQLSFEDIKHRLLMKLAEIDTHSETWRAKYHSEDSVTQLIAEYQVCNLLYCCCNCSLLAVCINFLQRGCIACNAERCNSYGNSVRLSVCHTLVTYPDE